MKSRISINIVTWNSMPYLPDLLRSVFAQTWKDFTVLIIDNGSDDGVEEFVRREYPQVKFLRNMRNLGFSAAHNQGIRFALRQWESEDLADRFILVTNPDIIFTPTYLEELMRGVNRCPEHGSFGGKLLKAFGENLEDEALMEKVESDIIDSTGIRAYKNRRFVDRGAGEMDKGQFASEEDVFGVSGALALYRASALEDVRFGDEFFDHDFFAYKEDIDLAWRFQWRGWPARYFPQAIAYHYRGMFGREKTSRLERIRNRAGKSSKRNYFSTRNHWNLLMKNESVLGGLLAAPRVFFEESGRILYLLAFERHNLRSAPDAIGRFPRMWKKRRATMQKKKASGKELRQWFV